MTDHTVNVAALIGSRICHDLISPVGAVTNGLELLAMSGVGDSPELSLVNNSAADATARIRLFRLAFGAASSGQKTGAEEVRAILRDHYSDGRITAEWRPTVDVPRTSAQAALLAVLCVEQSLPFGGTLVIDHAGGGWNVTGTSERIKEREALWSGLLGKVPLTDLAPADVQYLLLSDLLRDLGRSCTVTATEKSVTIAF